MTERVVTSVRTEIGNIEDFFALSTYLFTLVIDEIFNNIHV